MKNERKVREIIVIICSVVAITGATVYGHFTKEKADALGNGSAASSEEIASETDESPTWETATETTAASETTAKATTRRKSTTCATTGATNATTTTTVVEVKLEQNDEANCDDASKAKRNKSQPSSKSQNPTEKVSTQARESEVVAATTAVQTTVQTTAAAKVTETSTATTAITTSVEETTAEMTTEVEETTTEFVWNGKKLTRSAGIVPANETPSGYKETWYPWDLHGCLDLMGYSYDGYDGDCKDGVQRYNGYVMVASPDLNAHPKGSLIPTTLGMGIVVDFCPAGNLDIAVNRYW